MKWGKYKEGKGSYGSLRKDKEDKEGYGKLRKDKEIREIKEI